MDAFLDNSESEWDWGRLVNRERGLTVKTELPKGSVKMKALMLELNFPVQIGTKDRTKGYSYGQKWTYLNGKYYFHKGY